MHRILIVDDEPAVVDVVEFALRKGGFEVMSTATIAKARSVLESEAIDLLVLDLGLPDGDGLDLCRHIHAKTRLPTIILTCRDEEIDRVVGLESGADDYVVKPFSPRELVARVRSVLRRASADPTPSSEVGAVEYGVVKLDTFRHRVTMGESEIPLTPVEFDLLHTVLRSPEQVFTRDQLIDRVYHGEAFVSDRTIDSHVKNIRRRFAVVDVSADPIETVFGVGYRARLLP
jgi:two-component system OmpR family response regulator